MTRDPSAATNRRSLLRSAAWSAPALTLATATPAFAGSTLTPFSASLAQQSWATAPNPNYYLVLFLSHWYSGQSQPDLVGGTAIITFPTEFLHHEGVDHNVWANGHDVEVSGTGASRTATFTLTFDLPFNQGFPINLAVGSSRGAGFTTSRFTGTASAPGFVTRTF